MYCYGLVNKLPPEDTVVRRCHFLLLENITYYHMLPYNFMCDSIIKGKTLFNNKYIINKIKIIILLMILLVQLLSLMKTLSY